MPMTSPRRLHSGPPLLPGLMAASVCRKSWKRTRGVAQLQVAAALGADDAEGDRVAQPEGTAHGQHEIADLHAVAVAQRGGHQVGALDGQHGHVGVGIVPDLPGMEPPAVGQVDR